MDPKEQRLECLKIARELGGKPENLIAAANDLMAFIDTGAMPAVAQAEAAPVASEAEVSPPPAPEDAMAEVAATEPEPTMIDDAIAACGTVLEMPESGDLALAEPVAGDAVLASVETAAVEEVTEVATEAAVEVAEVLESEPVAVTEEAPPTESVAAEADASDGATEAADAAAPATNGSTAPTAEAEATPGA